MLGKLANAECECGESDDNESAGELCELEVQKVRGVAIDLQANGGVQVQEPVT